MFNLKTKNGFTLSEVLVVLGLIGILSTIIIPAVVSSRPDKSKVMLKKGYYILERVVSELVNDEKYYPEDETNPGLKNTCEVEVDGDTYGSNTSSDSDAKTKFCNTFASKVNTVTTPTCLVTTNANIFALDSAFTTADGITWRIPPVTADTDTFQVGIDVNGDDEGVNCTYNASTCKEPDRFAFTINTNGKITITDEKAIEYLKTTSLQKKK